MWASVQYLEHTYFIPILSRENAVLFVWFVNFWLRLSYKVTSWNRSCFRECSDTDMNEILCSVLFVKYVLDFDCINHSVSAKVTGNTVCEVFPVVSIWAERTYVWMCAVRMRFVCLTVCYVWINLCKFVWV